MFTDLFTWLRDGTDLAAAPDEVPTSGRTGEGLNGTNSRARDD
jgi:hypothetical protein